MRSRSAVFLKKKGVISAQTIYEKSLNKIVQRLFSVSAYNSK